jgi:hypothetical protein
MARYTYEVRYGNTPTVLGNVQSLSVTKGRQKIQDPFKAGTATISGRVPSSLPAIVIGTKIEIYCVDPSPDVLIFTGVVADYRINFGIVSSMDTWQIDCEDSLAAAGRSFNNPVANWSNNTNSSSAATFLSFYTGISIVNLSGVPGSSRLSAQNVANTNLLSVLQQIIFTEQGRLVNLGLDVFGLPSIDFVPRSVVGTYPVIGAFSDGTAATALDVAPFDIVQFNSQADSYFTQAVIEPAGLASQNSGSGIRIFTGQSYDVSTAQAQGLASYVLATLTVDNAVPQVISANSEIQSNDVALNVFASAGAGSQVTLILRGGTYGLFVEGGTMTATPDETRWSFYVVSNTAISGFVLDSATLGVLDQNKLGF